MKTLRLFVLILFSGVICGCSTTLKPRPLDAGGRFPTSYQLDAGGVKVAKPFPEKARDLAFVHSEAPEATAYAKFWVESIRHLRAFTNVVLKPELEALVIDKKLTSKVSGVSDLIGLHQLAEQIGPFLVVEPILIFRGGYNFTATLKAIDAASGETVLMLEQKAFNWSGLDDPLFYPLLNAFGQWTRGETISTGSKPAGPPPPTGRSRLDSKPAGPR